MEYMCNIHIEGHTYLGIHTRRGYTPPWKGAFIRKKHIYIEGIHMVECIRPIEGIGAIAYLVLYCATYMKGGSWGLTVIPNGVIKIGQVHLRRIVRLRHW